MTQRSQVTKASKIEEQLEYILNVYSVMRQYPGGISSEVLEQLYEESGKGPELRMLAEQISSRMSTWRSRRSREGERQVR